VALPSKVVSNKKITVDQATQKIKSHGTEMSKQDTGKVGSEGPGNSTNQMPDGRKGTSFRGHWVLPAEKRKLAAAKKTGEAEMRAAAV